MSTPRARLSGWVCLWRPRPLPFAPGDVVTYDGRVWDVMELLRGGQAVGLVDRASWDRRVVRIAAMVHGDGEVTAAAYDEAAEQIMRRVSRDSVEAQQDEPW